MLPVVPVSLPVISVICPTIDGREEFIENCTAKYAACAEGRYELDLVIEKNHPTCGHGWQAGLPRARGQYLHFTCDDIEPRPGWAGPAIECVQRGFLPAPQVYNLAGVPQSLPVWGVVSPDWAPCAMTALPFVSAGQLARIVPLFTSHYYSDNWFSFRASQAGWATRLRVQYTFTHHWAQHERGAGMSEQQRMGYDEVLYQQACRMAMEGQWREPWPPREIARPGG